MKKPKPKIAIVADWLTNQGGAEQVINAMAEIFPDAPIYTSVYTPGSVPSLVHREIRTTWLQKLPIKLRAKHQFLLLFLPGAFRRLDLSEFDIILSSSSAFAKNVRKTRPGQLHICYCHTPTRYLYNARAEYLDSYPLPVWLKPFRWLIPRLLDWLTVQDLKAAKAVDVFVSNSDYIAERIKIYYHQKALTLYPGIETKKFRPTDSKSDYFLALGRFIPYKKFDLLVETFVQNGLPLKLAGVGPELERCKILAAKASNIEFLGFVPDEAVQVLYAKARGFLFPAEEDFGLTPIEAMASGTPVIAYAKGGATETVTKDTGVFFDAQTPGSVQKALDQFIAEEKNFNQKSLTLRAQAFDTQVFQEKLKKLVFRQRLGSA